MRVVGVKSSPRKNSNSYALLKQCLAGIKATDDKAEITVYDLKNMNIGYCRGCNTCLRSNKPVCVQKDDMQEVYDVVEKADAIILSTPIYFLHMTAQLKTFIDRLYPLYPDKWNMTIYLLTTYGADNEKRAGVPELEDYFRSLKLFGVSYQRGFSVSTIDRSVEDNEKALKDAFEFGCSICR